MTPLSPEDLQSGNLRAQVTNLLTGETQELTTKNSSSFCFFFEPFKCGDYEVWLRLDWKKPDCHGNPILDADFHYSDTGEIDKSMKGHPAHHTTAEGMGKRVYLWEFGEGLREFQVRLMWSESVTDTANMEDLSEIRVIRAGKEIP